MLPKSTLLSKSAITPFDHFSCSFILSYCLFRPSILSCENHIAQPKDGIEPIIVKLAPTTKCFAVFSSKFSSS